MRAAVDRCDLDLTGLTVLTEAASGAYVVTPVLAAMAGAEVFAVAAGNAYASGDEIRELTGVLARTAGVLDRLELVDRKDPAIVGSADIVTNSGRIRPIDAETVGHMKPSAVVALDVRELGVPCGRRRPRGVPHPRDQVLDAALLAAERHPDQQKRRDRQSTARSTARTLRTSPPSIARTRSPSSWSP